MSHVTAKVASTLLIGVAAATVSTALPSRIVHAADSCLTEPKADTQGKHWYYHIERGTGRHCWYQRGQDEKSARDDDKQAASDKAPAANAAAAHSFADAHAEIAPKVVVPNSTNATTAPSVWPAPQAAAASANNVPVNSAAAPAPAQTTPDAPLASRWPQSADTSSSPAPQPETSLMVADAQDNAAASDASPQPAEAVAPPARPVASIQKLALVAFGALTLAGLTGSAVYRLGRRRRRNDWLRERNAWQEAQNPHRQPWVDEPRLDTNLEVADLDGDRHAAAPHSDFSLTMRETEDDNERVEKIEDFLARLTRQLHEELESTRPHNAA